MTGIILLVLIIAGVYCAVKGLEVRKRLKQTEYWKKIPKGTIFYGYCFPAALVLLSEKLWGKISFTLLSIVVIFVFICLVSGLNNELKTKPLRGTKVMLPDDVRKDVVFFCAVTPLITAFIFLLLIIIMDALSDLEASTKRRNKK